METGEFNEALVSDVQIALDTLLSFEYSEFHFDKPNWQDALGLVRDSVRSRPDLGVKLWDAVSDRYDLDEKRTQIWQSIANAWGNAELGESGPGVIHRLKSQIQDRSFARVIGRFLYDQIQLLRSMDEGSTVLGMRQLARGLWKEQGTSYTCIGDPNPLSPAPMYLNEWPGFLALYWNREVDRRWRYSPDEWTGLNGEESEALIELLSASEVALDAIQPAIAGKLYFYFSADEQFTQNQIFPILRDSSRHAFAWVPFLLSPRWSDRLLEAGLFEAMKEEFTRLNDLSGDNSLIRSFLGLVISVVSYSSIPLECRNNLLGLTVLALDGSYSFSFADVVVRFLREETVDGGQVWYQWLSHHVECRIKGMPRIASAKELERLADVVPLVGRFVPEAVNRFKAQGVGFGKGVFRDDLPTGVLDAYGSILIDFHAHRVSNTSDWDDSTRYRLKNLVDSIKRELGEAEARPIVEAAGEKGVILHQD